MSKITEKLKKIWITSKHPEYFKYYQRMRRYWRIDTLPLVFINLTDEEKKIYFKNKRLWII